MLSKVFRTILISLIPLISFSQSSELDLVLDSAYPQWLKSGSYRTDQTSGITFIGSGQGKKTFILADDLGSLHKFTIIDDCIFRLEPVHFSSEAESFLKDFPKQDFEEIVYDRYEKRFYLSIEGNTEQYAEYVGIYEIELSTGYDTLKSLKKLSFSPMETFLKYTAWNIGYEGLAVDSRYFYLGLEGFMNERQFADSTVLFIADKESGIILKEISTKSFGATSITGLYSDEDYSLWVLDRNELKIFHLMFDRQLNLISSEEFNFEPVIPGFTHLNYVGSYESITMDDEGNIYIVDDPWRQFFVPPDNILEQLDETARYNFKNHIPVLDRFQIKNKGDNSGSGN